MPLEKIVINVSGQTDLDSTIKKLVELGIVDEKNAKSFQANSKENQKQIEKTKSSYSGLKDAASQYLQALPGAQHVQQIQNLTKGMNQSGVAAQGATKGMNLLRMAMMSLPVVALVAAITSLVAYFKRTEEGGDRLAKIMSVLTVALDEVVKLAAWLGGIIIDTIVYGFELWFKGAVKIYDFLTGTFFAAIEAVAEGLDKIGFDSAAKSVHNLNESLKQGKKDLENYTNGLIKAGEKLADMEDKLEEKTIAIADANDVLTTAIQVQLKALRNRTNTYQESLAIIDKIGVAEKKRLDNSMSLIKDELDIEREKFTLQSANAKKAGELFDKYINRQIDAMQLAAQLDGTNTVETIKNISEILHKREEATRAAKELEEKLQNFKDYAYQQEQDRLDKLKKLREANQQAELQDLNNLKKLDLDTSNKKITLKQIETKEIKKLNDEALQNEYKKAEKEIALRKQVSQLAVDFAISSLSKIAAAQQDSNNIRIQNELHRSQTETDNEIASLERRKEAGLISENEFNAKRDAIQEKQKQKELQLKRKQAQQEKNFALFQIALNTASAIVKQLATTPLPAGAPFIAAIAAAGVVEAAIVQSRPLPEFKKGGYTGDGNPNAEAGIVHKAEFVMPAEKTAKYKEELQAMYEGRYSKDYRNPIKLQRSLTDVRGDSMAESLYNSIALNGQFNDKNIVNAINKNGKVKLANGSELAGQIASKIADRAGERGLFA